MAATLALVAAFLFALAAALQQKGALNLPVPVGVVVVAGERAAGLLARGQSWLTEHVTWLRVWLSTGIGVALLVDGLVRLVR